MDDPNNNGGLPVMTAEAVANALPPDHTEIPAAPEQQYTLLDDGSYQPVMDVLYPPGTIFYRKDEEGTYEATDSMPEVSQSQPLHDMTTEHIIASAKDFLTAHGYTVLDPNAVSGVEPTNGVIGLSADNASVKQEISGMLASLRSLFNAHASTHAAVREAHDVISRIESYL